MLSNRSYHWYDRYCIQLWLQDLLHGSRAQVTNDDPVVGVYTVIPRAVVIGHSSEKPSQHRCGPRQVRLFCDGPLCSRDTEVSCREHGARSNVNWNQYLRVLVDMP